MEIMKEMQKRKQFLMKILKRCEKSLQNAPEGNLKVNSRNGKTYYLLRGYRGKEHANSSGGDAAETSNLTNANKDSIDRGSDAPGSAVSLTSETQPNISSSAVSSTSDTQPTTVKSSLKFIRKRDRRIAAKIAQRDYDREIIRLLKQEIGAIEAYEKKFPQKCIEEIYEGLNPGRKPLIKPYLITDKQYADAWINEKYTGKGFTEKDAFHFTKRGERVRSKSEVLIADMLAERDIPYKYEYPTMANGTIYHPDFKILKLPERKIYYWEHFGKMEDMVYVKRNMIKIFDYETAGIFPGKQLLFTMETKDMPLNKQQIKAIIDEFLI